MDIKQLETYFQGDNLLNLIDVYADTFLRLEEIEDTLRAGSLSPDMVADFMVELSAIYSSLSTVVEISETYKVNEESKFFHNKWIAQEKSGKKPIVASIEKEASLAVSNFRRIRSIFTAKRDGCDKMIYALQSSLKSFDREKLLHK